MSAKMLRIGRKLKILKPNGMRCKADQSHARFALSWSLARCL